MKVLFIGDYSNYHVTLAKALRKMGHECMVVSSGSRCMDTERDITLRRVPGIVGGFGYLYRLQRMMPQLQGYDVVQIINPNFLELRPMLTFHYFEQLKKHNGKVCLSVCGSDPVIVEALCSGKTLRYSEFRIGQTRAPYAVKYPEIESEWLSVTMKRHCRRIYEAVDHAISSLYEYQVISEPVMGDKLRYLGIPIDTDEYGLYPAGEHERLNLFVGIKSELEDIKGTNRLLAAARRVAQEYPDLCYVTEARDLPYTEYMQQLQQADIVLDQIYSYTPATNALQAMAMGKVAVSGAEPEYYRFIGEQELQPIVNVLPEADDAYRKLKSLVQDRDLVRRLGQQGPEFVRRHNSAKDLAAKYLEIIRG